MKSRLHKPAPAKGWVIASLLVTGCATADLNALEQQRSELELTNDQLRQEASHLRDEAVALAQERSNLLERAGLTLSTRSELNGLLDRLRRVRVQPDDLSLATTSASRPTTTTATRQTTTTTTTDPRKPLEIYFTGLQDSRGMSGTMATDLGSGWIRGTFYPSTSEVTSIELSTTTPDVCELTATKRSDHFVTGHFDLRSHGTCSVQAIYEGDSVYAGASTTVSFEIRKITRKIFALYVEDSNRRNVSQGVDPAAGPVTIILRGDAEAFPDVTSNTPATCSVSAITQDTMSLNFRVEVDLATRGECSITASYAEDDFHEPASTTEAFTIK